jgi:hypothetical protein
VVVMADSLFEAAAMALRAFNAHGCPPGPAARLHVQVTPPPVTHIVTVQKVEDWLKGGARSPREALLKKRLHFFVISQGGATWRLIRSFR